jgi:hypothetical protein
MPETLSTTVDLQAEQLQLGQLPPEQAEAVLGRLKATDQLDALARAAAADDTLLRALGSLATHPPPTPDARLEALMSRLSALSPTPDEPAPAEGGRLGGYRLVELLGRGGMGLVYLAEDEQLRRQVALKVVRPEAAAAPGARQRFLREARSAAAIEHDHIVPVYHVGEEGDVFFLAMPLLRGESLESVLRRAGGAPLAVSEVLRIGREVAEGLAAAHERGLVHRDVKPSNLWLEGERRRVRILDFGLARPLDDGSDLTPQGVVLGTPAYMAPEQASGSAVDGRSDLFSLGCVLYQLATGEKAFDGEHIMAILARLATHQPPPPQHRNPLLPPALSGLIVRLLAKQPDDRPPSARAVADALGALASGAETCEPARPRRGAVRWLVGALLGLAAAAGIVVIVKDRTGKVIATVEVPDGGSVQVRPDGKGKRAADEARRQAVAWVVSKGGSVEVEGVGWVKEVPEGRFRVTAIHLSDRKAPLGEAELLDQLSDFPDALGAFNVFDMPLTNAGLERLCRLPCLRDATALVVAATEITDAGLSHLRGLPLTALVLSGNKGITGGGLKHLAELDRLTSLNLAATRIESGSLEALRGKLPRLRELWLDGTRVANEDMAAVGSFEGLVGLSLASTLLKPGALAPLKGLTRLQGVTFYDTGLTDDDLPSLRGWKALVGLDLRGTLVTDGGLLEHLKGLDELRALDVGGCVKVTAEGVKALKKALPKCKVGSDFPGPEADG